MLLIFVAQFAIGVMNSSIAGLTLEQVPEYRGTLMSLLSVAANIGQMSSAVMGFILISYNYNVLGVVLGLIGIVAVGVIHIFSVDPVDA
jgi:MFS family permease